MDSFQENQFTLRVFVDLSKSFDTVNHVVLLTKLLFFGVEGTYLKWFKSYLHNRKLFVTYGNNKGANTRFYMLGPLLFLLYDNELHNATKILQTITFADDKNLFCHI